MGAALFLAAAYLSSGLCSSTPPPLLPMIAAMHPPKASRTMNRSIRHPPAPMSSQSHVRRLGCAGGGWGGGTLGCAPWFWSDILTSSLRMSAVQHGPGESYQRRQSSTPSMDRPFNSSGYLPGIPSGNYPPIVMVGIGQSLGQGVQLYSPECVE